MEERMVEKLNECMFWFGAMSIAGFGSWIIWVTRWRRLLEWLRLWPFGHTWQSLFMSLWRQGNGRNVLGCYCRDYLRRASWESLMCNWGWHWHEKRPGVFCRKLFDIKDLQLFWFSFGFFSCLPLTCADKYNILIRRLECCIYWLPRVRWG